MLTLIVDTNCMIHLHRVDLLKNALRLPYRFVMPFSLFMDEWLSIGLPEKDMLLELGLELQPVAGNLVDRAGHYYFQHAELKLNDCFARVLSQEIENSFLLSGDSKLRKSLRVKGSQSTVYFGFWTSWKPTILYCVRNCMTSCSYFKMMTVSISLKKRLQSALDVWLSTYRIRGYYFVYKY